MSQNKKTDIKEFNELQKMGFEFRAPQDELSYQPDSGSSATGEIGKHEYGIDIDIDAQPYENDISAEGDGLEDPTIPIPGESEWSQKNRLQEDREETIDKGIDSDSLLFTLIYDRLTHDPKLRRLSISIEVEKGEVILSGEVPDSSTKTLVDKIVEGLPGVVLLNSELTIFLPK
jgi:hypothetical protein